MAKLCFLLLAFLHCSLTLAICEFEANPVVLEKRELLLLQYWDFSSLDSLDSSELPDSRSFHAYRDVIQSQINTDPLSLLQRYLLTNPDESSFHNIKIASSKEFKAIGCLEALLLDQQIKRNPIMAAEPTEFVAFYLVKDQSLRVYYQTEDMNGLRNMRTLQEFLLKDHREGWKLVGNLHNHSFFLAHLNENNKLYPLGVLSPSASDVSMFRILQDEFGLISASVTNGFNTLEVSAQDFFHYRAH